VVVRSQRVRRGQHLDGLRDLVPVEIEDTQSVEVIEPGRVLCNRLLDEWQGIHFGNQGGTLLDHRGAGVDLSAHR
jgi:hypothetical protein